MTRIDFEAARAICDAATPGPWQWFGNTKMADVYLATTDRGRVFVMDFVRWGMTGAQPRFQVRLGSDGGIMRKLSELGEEESPLGPKFEVSYRRQFVGIGHPDAEFIAAARTGWPAALDEIERLRREVDDLHRDRAEEMGRAERMTKERDAATLRATKAEGELLKHIPLDELTAEQADALAVITGREVAAELRLLERTERDTVEAIASWLERELGNDSPAAIKAIVADLRAGEWRPEPSGG